MSEKLVYLDGLKEYDKQMKETYIEPLNKRIDNISSGGASIIDVTELPTSNFDTNATYRMMKGTFYMKHMARGDSKCYVVEWNAPPTEPGESVFIETNYGFGFTGYYNKINDTVYGYFGADTIEMLREYVNASDLNVAIKAIVLAALGTMSAGWQTMEQILNKVGTALSINWGGVVTSNTVEAMPEENNLYLYLSSDLFSYLNNTWVKLDNVKAGYLGQGMGGEIFNCLENVALGTATHAEGHRTQAIGNASHAEGYETEASGTISHAEGDGSVATGMVAHAEGYHTKASGNYAHTEGMETEATAHASHAGGWGTKATAEAQTVIGKYNHEDMNALFIVGNGENSTNPKNAFTVRKDGSAEFAGKVTFKQGIGYVQTGAKAGTTVGEYATAEGYQVTASGFASHAEGVFTEATSNASHAEGHECKAIGEYSHAEGHSTTVEGHYSHAEGQYTYVAPEAGWAHVEGAETEARANLTHAEGYGTIAASMHQHVQGRFNNIDEESMYAHIVGNGENDNDRSNAHTIDWDGNAWFEGNIKIGGEGQDDVNAQLVATQNWVKSYTQGGSEGNANTLVPIYWSELKNLQDNGELIPGQFYRIIDYDCIIDTTIANSEINNPFDIIVQAISNFELSENARATYSDRDMGYFRTIKRPEIYSSNISESLEGTLTNLSENESNSIIQHYFIIENSSSLSYFGGDAIVAIGYFRNNLGALVPTLHKMYEDDIDLEEICYYCGKQEYNGDTYDVWRKIEPYEFGWEDDGRLFVLTNELVGIGKLINLNFETTFQQLDSGGIEKTTNLNAWELKYCLNNDTDRFDWASPEGKGIIYWMKDEWGNECPYDFKNIMFDGFLGHSGYTFQSSNHSYNDLSLFGGASNNIISPTVKHIDFNIDTQGNNAYRISQHQLCNNILKGNRILNCKVGSSCEGNALTSNISTTLNGETAYNFLYNVTLENNILNKDIRVNSIKGVTYKPNNVKEIILED